MNKVISIFILSAFLASLAAAVAVKGILRAYKDRFLYWLYINSIY